MTANSVKQRLIDARSADTTRSRTRTGKPARQLRSAWHDAWESVESPEPLPMPLQSLLVDEAWERIDRASETGHPGARELESWFVGQVVGRMNELRPAREVALEIIRDCEDRLTTLSQLRRTA